MYINYRERKALVLSTPSSTFSRYQSASLIHIQPTPICLHDSYSADARFHDMRLMHIQPI